MSARNAAILIFVGLGLFAGVSALVLLALQSSMLVMEGGTSGMLPRAFALMPSAVLIALSIQLVRKRTRFAEAVFPDNAATGAPADSRSLQVLGIALVGLHTLVLSMPKAVLWAVDLLNALSAHSTLASAADPRSLITVSGVLSSLASTVIAALLVINREAIADYLFGVSEVATDVASSAEEDGPSSGARE